MPKVTVIIVKYHAPRQLKACLASLKGYPTIIVDNDQLNRGYAAGNNLGAKQVSSEYLLILNPDTVVYPGAITTMVKFLDTHPHVGIVAPLLLDPAGRPYPLQGTRELTPLSGIFVLSFLNRIPNPISRRYWLADWDKKSLKSVDVVPGTAFLIRKDLFTQIGGFDENFFLYFDETDLCRRVRQAGWEIYINPAAQIMHVWGASTPKSPKTKSIFTASRFYYFQKHFGLAWAVIIHLVCSFSMLWLALIIGTFLRFYKLSSQMPFIGDQAWFYLSARDALLGRGLPLLGITASITWLHQGPLWTYFLVPLTSHPVLPAILTGISGLISIYLIYFLGGWPASLLLAILPLSILQSRMPYHTSLIPLFSLLTFHFFLRKRDFLAGLFLGFLYQLHLLTFIFWPIMFWRRKAIPGFLLGISTFLLAGPVQTFGIFAWIGKHILTGFGGSTISTAYLIVLLVPGILILSKLIKVFPWLALFILAYSLTNQTLTLGPTLSNRVQLSKSILSQSNSNHPEIIITGAGAKFSTSRMPYDYLLWWLSKSNPASGTQSSFQVIE